MKIISYLYILSLSFNNIGNCYQINNLKNNLIPTKINKNNQFLLRLNSNLNSNIKFTNNNSLIKNKLIGYLKLIRYKNIFPTVYLFLTGAWIVNPNINILHNKRLLYSLSSTLCILMSNMVINDLFDMKLDRINNPTRPLITGDVSVKEANILLLILLSITEYINIYFLPKEIKNIIHLSLLYTFIYTPILKKIPLIKNLSCALIVSLSIYNGALSSGINKNLKLLYQIISLVFLGSFYNEILLDIHDHEGDKQNNIRTISTLFGKRVALSISEFILSVNINYNVILLCVYGNVFYAILFCLLSIPISVDLLKIIDIQHYDQTPDSRNYYCGVDRDLEMRRILMKSNENNYKKENIKKAVNTSSAQLLFMLSLFLLLSIK